MAAWPSDRLTAPTLETETCQGVSPPSNKMETSTTPTPVRGPHRPQQGKVCPSPAPGLRFVVLAFIPFLPSRDFTFQPQVHSASPPEPTLSPSHHAFLPHSSSHRAPATELLLGVEINKQKGQSLPSSPSNPAQSSRFSDESSTEPPGPLVPTCWPHWMLATGSLAHPVCPLMSHSAVS